MQDNIHIIKNPRLLAVALSDFFQKMIIEIIPTRDKIYVAFSGGTTPGLFFETLADNFGQLPWKNIHIFWVDERCVPPASTQSNYALARKSLLDRIEIPTINIHRILGEADPESESKRYSNEIKQLVSSDNHWPVFDWILLGLGEDGHTASLFPDSTILDNTSSIAAVAIHPSTKQKRITLTLPVLNHARRITFLVSGRSKAKVVKKILLQDKDHPTHPAALVNPPNGRVDWFLDRGSAEQIS